MRPGKRDAHAVFYQGEDFVSSAPAGAFRWTGLYGIDDALGPFGMNFKCPCGCGAVHGVGFTTRPKDWNQGKDQRWEWNGDKAAPTLMPSLGLHKSRDDQTVSADGYHWHGFLRVGVFEEC